MSTTTYVEATSNDPFVRELHRRAMRLLNDPLLDRRQREFHMRRLQSSLLEHQALQAAKAAKQAAKSAQREQVSRSNRNQGVADQSQVLARRKEFGMGAAGTQEAPRLKEPEVSAPVAATEHQGVALTVQKHRPGRSRPLLTLRNACA